MRSTGQDEATIFSRIRSSSQVITSLGGDWKFSYYQLMIMMRLYRDSVLLIDFMWYFLYIFLFKPGDRLLSV